LLFTLLDLSPEYLPLLRHIQRSSMGEGSLLADSKSARVSPFGISMVRSPRLFTAALRLRNRFTSAGGLDSVLRHTIHSSLARQTLTTDATATRTLRPDLRQARDLFRRICARGVAFPLGQRRFALKSKDREITFTAAWSQASVMSTFTAAVIRPRSSWMALEFHAHHALFSLGEIAPGVAD
jgi:hypothetical protein